MWLAAIMKCLAMISKERERTVRGALGGTDRTVHYIAILWTRALIISVMALLVIIGYVIYRLV